MYRPRSPELHPAEVERRYLLSLPSPRSRERMRRCIARLVEVSGGDWAALDRLDVLRTVRALDLLAVGTQRLHVACLRGLLRAADADPRIIQAARARKGTPEPAGRVLSREEQGRLLNAAHSDRDRALVLALLATGLRVSEVVALDVANLRGDILTVRVGKGRKGRVVALGPRAASALRAHVGGRLEGPLLVTRDGGRMSQRGVQLVLHTIAGRAGIGHVSPHDLRRSCATTAAAAGAPLDAVRAHLGHASLATQRYLRADPAELSRAVADALAR